MPGNTVSEGAGMTVDDELVEGEMREMKVFW
jgi:hypothetical protein